MRTKFIIPVLMLSAMVISGNAAARSWRVELDGSGDFADIQPAVDASAAGDSILIGPGRFDTFHSVVAPAWTEETVVWVTRDNLTFVGAGQGSTIIGPTSHYSPYGQHPKGICSIDGFQGKIRDLTIENIKEGVYWWRGNLAMEGCTISGDDVSFVAMLIWPYGATIRNCTIDTHFNGTACVIGRTSRDILFENCDFLGYGYGVAVMDATQGVQVVGSRFVNSTAGLWCDNQSTATAVNCSFTNIYANAITARAGSQLNLDSVHVDGAGTGLSVSGGSHATGTNCVFENSRNESILACCNAFVTIHNSHILAGTGYTVRCMDVWAHSQFPDLTGNYWGTTDAEAIRASIWDANDTSETNGVVYFEPTAGGPVPTESTSWGDLKAFFR